MWRFVGACLALSACGGEDTEAGYASAREGQASTSTNTTSLGGSSSTSAQNGSTSTDSAASSSQNAATASGSEGVGGSMSSATSEGSASSAGGANSGGATSSQGVGAQGGSTTGAAQPNTSSAGGTAVTSGGDTTLSFAADIWPLWEMERQPPFDYRGRGTYTGCTADGVCHGGTSPGAGLSMPDAQAAYSALIDVPSNSSICDDTLRVVVGDPDNSCLILFYVGRLGKDDLDWVDDTEIELMREWIRQGALP